MANKRREFRSLESLAAEKGRRDALIPYLTAHGFTQAEDDQKPPKGTAVEQFIRARSPDGNEIYMRVRLCWHRRGRHRAEHLFSAAQLTAKLRKDLDHEGTVELIRDRDANLGVTHILFAQDDRQGRMISAALVPTACLPGVWKAQYTIADRLMKTPGSGVTANRVLNGQSPTIWLQDDRTPETHLIADALWNYPGVIRLGPASSAPLTLQDLVIRELIGRDGADAVLRMIASYPRDSAVRKAVLKRALGRCERRTCNASQPWAGFLDVHHVLGVAVSDREWNCVALCPNCHREAHFSPEKDSLNAELLATAQATSDAITAGAHDRPPPPPPLSMKW